MLWSYDSKSYRPKATQRYVFRLASRNYMSNIALTVRVCVPAYSRARETACDHIGSYLSGDFEASRSALQMLGCGCRRLNQVMKCEPFIAQEAMVPAIA